jgi:hypothetical protein
MLSVKFLDTGQIESVVVYTTAAFKKSNNDKVTNIIFRYADNDEGSLDYCMVGAVMDEFLFRYCNHQMMKDHSDFFLSDRSGEEETSIIIWSVVGKADGNLLLQNTGESFVH